MKQCTKRWVADGVPQRGWKLEGDRKEFEGQLCPSPAQALWGSAASPVKVVLMTSNAPSNYARLRDGKCECF